MSPVSPTPGDSIRVKTAFGDYREKRAVTGIIDGDLFQVVRVCSPDEWSRAEREQRVPVSTPWPADDVLTSEAP